MPAKKANRKPGAVTRPRIVNRTAAAAAVFELIHGGGTVESTQTALDLANVALGNTPGTSTTARIARYAELRRAEPRASGPRIWLQIHDEEVDAAEAAEGRRIAAEDEARADRYQEGAR